MAPVADLPPILDRVGNWHPPAWPGDRKVVIVIFVVERVIRVEPPASNGLRDKRLGSGNHENGLEMFVV